MNLTITESFDIFTFSIINIILTLSAIGTH
jgi:hypothetical protein